MSISTEHILYHIDVMRRSVEKGDLVEASAHLQVIRYMFLIKFINNERRGSTESK